jgi:cardiolipin synthase (CMP-forming)
MPEPESTRRSVVSLPNFVSLSRVALTPAIAWAMLNDRGALALGLFGLVVLSDLFDGFIARRIRQTTRLGTLLDHGADATFVVSVTALGAYLGLLPLILAPLIAIAFIQYVVDSRLLAGAGLRPSAVGRWNGIGYFVVSGFAIFTHHYAHEAGVLAALRIFGWLLAGTTVLSITQRTLHLVRARRD